MVKQKISVSVRVRHVLGSAALLAILGGGSTAYAQTTYNIAGIADFTGPFADVMKDITGCRRGVFD